MNDDGNSTPKAIGLLVMCSSQERTTEIVRFLRDRGLAVHATQETEADRLAERVANGQQDLILCCASDPKIDLPAVMEQYPRLAVDVPLLVLADADEAQERLLHAMRAGARDLVESTDLQYLLLVVARELRDLSARRELRRLQRQLQDCEQRSRSLVRDSQEAIAFVHQGMHLNANEAYLALLGIPDIAELQQIPLLDTVADANRKALRDFIRSFEQGTEEGPVNFQVTVRRLDGGELPATLEATKSIIDDETCVRLVLRSAQAMGAPPVPYAIAPAGEIPLGIAFRQQIQSELVKPGLALLPLGVNLILLDDIDGIRTVLGPFASTDVFEEIAKVLSNLVRSQDGLFGCLGDGLFCAIHPDMAAEELEKTAERIRSAVAKHRLRCTSVIPGVTVSLGTAVGPDATDPDTLILTAQRAALTARDNGGDRVCPAVNGELITSNKRRGRAGATPISEAVDEVLARDALTLSYDPILALSSEDTKYCFAKLPLGQGADDDRLLESLRSQWGQISGLAELERRMVRQAISDLADRLRDEEHVQFFLPLSLAALTDGGFADWTEGCLSEFGVEGSHLTFFIREEDFADSYDQVMATAELLIRLGSQIALDDYGMLPNPENLLGRCPTVKFARLAPEIVKSFARQRETKSPLPGILEKLRKHNIKPVAQTTDDPRIFSTLWSAGVAYLQGYRLPDFGETLRFG